LRNKLNKSADDYIEFSARQSKIEQVVERRLSQLDSCQIRLTKEESMTEHFSKEISDLQTFCFDLQNNKVNKTKFEERSIDFYTDIRKLGIQVEKTEIEMKTLANFCEKYIPLQTQNAISTTLHGFMNSVQQARLEDYEFSKFGELHEIILDDDGEPHLDKRKESIIAEVNNKLIELKKLYKERHLVARTRADSEIGDEDEKPIDEEDIAEVIQKQIKEIQIVVDNLPQEFRRIDEEFTQKVDETHYKADERIRVLESHITDI